MKITDVKTFFVDPGVSKNWLFVKVETDEGISGWGEAYNYRDRAKSTMAHADSMKQYLIGRSPFNIKHFTQVMFDDYAGRRGSMGFFCVVSGIEQALWDIVGKTLNTPVYNLLGGACREKIRVYANGWYSSANTPQESAEKAVETLKGGFTALKFDPFPGPWRSYISKQDEKAAVEVVKAIREAVGPDIDLLIEVHRRLSPMNAVRVARMLEEFDPFWYEEPVPSVTAGVSWSLRKSQLWLNLITLLFHLITLTVLLWVWRQPLMFRLVSQIFSLLNISSTSNREVTRFQ